MPDVTKGGNVPMRRVRFMLALALAAAIAGPLAAQAPPPSGAFAQGIEHFQAGRYDQALAAFRGIALSPTDDPQKPAAYFWMSKTQLAAGSIDAAASGLSHYLATWPKAADREEAVYLQGRILHQQEDFEAAIRMFRGFLEDYPSSPFTANAWFWSAECLYGLGRLEEASALYQKVVREYPTSAKVEAAQYKASLIGLKQREQELSRLLKWSHEELLRTIEEYQRRQEASDQALEVLQKRLAGTATGAAGTAVTGGPAAATAATAASEETLADLREELEWKTAEAMTLSERVGELEGRLAEADEKAAAAEAAAVDAIAADTGDDGEEARDLAARILELEEQLAAAEAAAAASAAGTAEIERLLAAKAEALALKELLLDWLERTEAQP